MDASALEAMGGGMWSRADCQAALDAAQGDGNSACELLLSGFTAGGVGEPEPAPEPEPALAQPSEDDAAALARGGVLHVVGAGDASVNGYYKENGATNAITLSGVLFSL